MNSIGIIRRLDDFGRIVIPKNALEKLLWKENDPIEISVTEDGHAILRKYIPADRDGLLLISDQIETLLCHATLKGAARDYLEQAFTELKCAVEALTLDDQDEKEKAGKNNHDEV